MTLTYPRRLGLLLLLAGSGALVLLLRLLQLQWIEQEKWERLARKGLELSDEVPGRRGRILDARGRVLAEDRPSFDLVVVPDWWHRRLFECDRCGARRREANRPDACRWCKSRGSLAEIGERDLETLARALGVSAAALAERIEEECYAALRGVERSLARLPEEEREAARPDYENEWLMRERTLYRDVPYAVAREIGARPERHHAFAIRTLLRRETLGGPDFAHVLGIVSERRSADGASSDAAGATGLEYALDAVLRGAPGRVTWRHDPRGGAKQIVEKEEAKPGADLRLTIDASTQRSAVECLAGADADAGAFVLLDARTGAVLALASTPNFDPADYAEVFAAWRERPRGSPLLDRAAREIHLPGSVVKPVTAVAGLLSGAVRPDETICCQHYFYKNGLRQIGGRCHGEHGEIDLHGALMVSCNIYFETIVDRLLSARAFGEFVRAGRAFGFGQPTGLETEPRSGRLGRWDEEPTRWQKEGRVLTGIGQGDVALTVAQVARAYAGLATGALPRLHLTEGAVAPPAPLGIPASVLEPIRAALADVASPRGSAHSQQLERYGVVCKTGTAQVGTGRGGAFSHNAWLAGWIPPRNGRPLVAFAMAIFGGDESGAHACGPRLLRFLRAFYDEEVG